MNEPRRQDSMSSLNVLSRVVDLLWPMMTHCLLLETTTNTDNHVVLAADPGGVFHPNPFNIITT